MDPNTPPISSPSTTSTTVEQEGQASPVETPTPQSTYGKRNLKRWILFYIVLAIVVYGGVYAYMISRPSQNPYSPTSNYPVTAITQTPTAVPTVDATANWKTYTDPKNSYSFRYPNDYKIITDTPTALLIAQDQLGSKGIKILTNTDQQYVVANSLDTCRTVLEKIKQNPSIKPGCLEQGSKYGQSKDIDLVKLGGKDVNSFYVTNTGMGGTTHVMQTINTPLIQLTSSDPNEDIFNQILQTFKFTDQATPSPTTIEGGFCGGIANIQCAKPYQCVLDGNYPDAGGKCAL